MSPRLLSTPCAIVTLDPLAALPCVRSSVSEPSQVAPVSIAQIEQARDGRPNTKWQRLADQILARCVVHAPQHVLVGAAELGDAWSR